MDQENQMMQTAISLKSFLLKQGNKSNSSLYEHLTRVLMRIIDERPQDSVDMIEDISLDVKRALFESKQNFMQDLPVTRAAERLAKQQSFLFTQESDPEDPLPLPNVSEIGFFLEQAGVGLGREELMKIFLALKLLVDSHALQHCRLWGKILGREQNYIVAEAEYPDDDVDDEVEEEQAEEDTDVSSDDIQEEEILQPPKSTYKPPPPVKKEMRGSGTNKFVYYVCSEPGLPWVKLPVVTPAQINVARQIQKFFTGRLDAPVLSYPPFPGNESNYLRAQIARISAGTQVSPQGYYKVVDEEGDEDEEASRDTCEVNPDFEGIPVANMVDSFTAWVHHIQHILMQGRCTWKNPAGKKQEESSALAEDEELEASEEVEPEVGPPLLTPLSEDEDIFDCPPWTILSSTKLISQHAVAVVRSNVWPGAFTYASEKAFENIYIGWGQKYSGEGYSPPVPPLPEKEYMGGPEITEDVDPSWSDEQEQEALAKQVEELEDMDEDDDEDDDQQ
ncbi:radial spoke head protein 4 homolog A-like isoform X1 [Synchiropus splendidus]|uniref:radial spoke head protein 4 homolog A-like isoform X1 n=1 Tax=Synchiropus splendidus TaxID=270530 RepID=UPI00237E11E6|nr:radial spoke head protein 4 homolog A-like isoform X1 [Synchiropus splendidus]